MGSEYLFIIGYMGAAIFLAAFSVRVRRVYLLDRSLVFRYIYVGLGLIAASFPFYALPYLRFGGIWLTILNFIADSLLFLGLFFVSSFPLHFWGALWRKEALARWIRWSIFALILSALAVTVFQYVTASRPLVEVTENRIFIDHAPTFFNIFKISLIVFGGVASGITNIYYGAESRSVRSYLLGSGIAIMSLGGAVTVFSYEEKLATIGDILYAVGGICLIGGLFTPRRPAHQPKPAEPQPVQPQMDPYR